MKNRQEERLAVEFNGQSLPVKVIRERRMSLRASVGKDSLIFRVPWLLSPDQHQHAWQWFRQWANARLTAQPHLWTHLCPRQYRNGELFPVGARIYRLHIVRENRKTSSAKLAPAQRIDIKLSAALPEAAESQAIRALISRVVAQDFLPAITQRVQELNAQYFQQEISAVRLKHNASNWGSCSRTGNINLSTRLLFAPDPVIDYVIIHELAHRVEFNHSERFWQLVAQAMPNYREQERWLKTNYYSCAF